MGKNIFGLLDNNLPLLYPRVCGIPFPIHLVIIPQDKSVTWGFLALFVCSFEREKSIGWGAGGYSFPYMLRNCSVIVLTLQDEKISVFTTFSFFGGWKKEIALLCSNLLLLHSTLKVTVQKSNQKIVVVVGNCNFRVSKGHSLPLLYNWWG